MAKLIDGKLISTQIKRRIKRRSGKIKTRRNCSNVLQFVQVGKDPASSVYVNNKKKACAFIGIESLSYELDETVTEEELLSLVQKLNEDEKVNGILVQLPLPAHIREDAVIQRSLRKKMWMGSTRKVWEICALEEMVFFLALRQELSNF